MRALCLSALDANPLCTKNVRRIGDEYKKKIKTGTFHGNSNFADSRMSGGLRQQRQ